MLDDGQTFYEQHREDCAGWGMDPLPAWYDLTPEQRQGWEEAASEQAEKMLNDRKELHA